MAGRGALVVGRRQPGQHGGQPILDLVQCRLPDPAGLGQPGGGHREVLQAEDRGQQFVQARGAAEECFQLTVRKERTVVDESRGPAEALDASLLLARTCTATADAAKSAPAGDVLCAVAGPAPSTTNSAVIFAWSGWCMLRQPCFQTAGSFSQRRRFPVSSTSSASAKLDFPLPLRPTTRVSPGRGDTVKVADGPIPRNPLTVSDRR